MEYLPNTWTKFKVRSDLSLFDSMSLEVFIGFCN
jgi:hypothetical protein